MPHKWNCGVCGASGEEEEKTDARIAGGRHVGTEHPDVYEAVTGHKPTEERLAGQELIERSRFSAS